MESMAKSLCARLNIKYTDAIVPFYEKGVSAFKEKKYAILDKERILRLNTEYGLLSENLHRVLKASELIARDTNLVVYIYMLASAIEERASLDILETPDRESADTDFAPLFSILYFIDDMIRKMKERGLPHKVISDTLQEFDAQINDYNYLFGRPGVRIYVGWLMQFLRGEIIRIGRFNFQMTTLADSIRGYKKGGDIKILIDGAYVHKNGMLFGSAGQEDEAERFYASVEEENGAVIGYCANALGECETEKIRLCGYEEFVRKGDRVLSVHIPSFKPLSEEISESSYREAVGIFERFYPEFKYKAFHCRSWMLEKRLRLILGKDTNITRFSERYAVYPTVSAGKDVYEYLYGLRDIKPASELAENNSMQRAVKKYLCEGNHIYEKGGIFIAAK